MIWLHPVWIACQEMKEPEDKSEWGMGAHIVNAYYNPLNNEVVFPAGILQPPFYNPEADAAINYGAIGGVIGHEFSHGFDDQGSKYGPDGNLENWWTEQDKSLFGNRDRYRTLLPKDNCNFDALKIKSMTINEAINHENVSLVDVRTSEEVAMESVPGAVNIPLDDIPERWEEFRDMPRPLVLFCRSGVRSGKALAFLEAQGITDGMNGMGASDVLIELM